MDASLVVKPDAASKEQESLLETLRACGVRARTVEAAAEARGDVAILVGDNAFILSTIRELPDGLPVLGVGSRSLGALAEVSTERFQEAARRLASGDFRVEDVDRMECVVGDRARGLALNEAALVSAASGQYVRHSLWVDDELMWRDRGDGVIVATPTGSTAYAHAAGGPVVLAKTPVFSVVPICSSDGNRPFVVSTDAAISLTDVSSTPGAELVLDGRERLRVPRGEVVRIRRAARPVQFVRLSEERYTQILGRLRTRRDAGPTIKEAPPSAKFLLKLLEYEGPLTQAEMVRASHLSERTVRNAASYLVDQGVVVKEPSLRDARQDVYALRDGRGKR